MFSFTGAQSGYRRCCSYVYFQFIKLRLIFCQSLRDTLFLQFSPLDLGINSWGCHAKMGSGTCWNSTWFIFLKISVWLHCNGYFVYVMASSTNLFGIILENDWHATNHGSISVTQACLSLGPLLVIMFCLGRREQQHGRWALNLLFRCENVFLIYTEVVCAFALKGTLCEEFVPQFPNP